MPVLSQLCTVTFIIKFERVNIIILLNLKGLILSIFVISLHFSFPINGCICLVPVPAGVGVHKVLLTLRWKHTIIIRQPVFNIIFNSLLPSLFIMQFAVLQFKLSVVVIS